MFDQVIEYIEANFNIYYNTVSNELCITKLNQDGSHKIINESTFMVELRKAGFGIAQSEIKMILASDIVKHIDPIVDYFESLPQKAGNTQLVDKLCDYFVVNKADKERFRLNILKALLRTVDCAINPKAFNKQCVVLVSPKQNIGKTSFCRWLCPPSLNNYYSENMTLDKDGRLALCENFMINLDELSIFDRGEINKLKSILSIDSDKSRRPYEARATSRPRRATFWASTNDSLFLSDLSGNVRWICFEIQEIDFNYSKEINIDDLWAEIYALYKLGYTGKLSVDEVRLNEEANQSFMQDTTESDLIRKYFLPGNKDAYDQFYTATELILRINDLVSYPSSIKLVPSRLGKVLTGLGFVRESKTNPKGYSNKGYYVKEIN